MAQSFMTCADFKEKMEKGLIKVGEFKEGLPFAPVSVLDPETNKSSRIVIQTPEMSAPYGITLPWSAKDNGLTLKTIEPNAKCTMDLSFEGIDKRPSMQCFKKGMECLDDHIVKSFTDRSLQIFNKKISEENIREERFKSNIREETPKSAAAFKLSLNRKDGKFNFKVCDDSYNPIDLSQVETRKSKVTAIIKCNGIWKVGKNFGLSWSIEQMRIIPGVKFQGFQFIEDVDRLATPEMIEASCESIDETMGTKTEGTEGTEGAEGAEGVEGAEGAEGAEEDQSCDLETKKKELNSETFL